MGYITLGVLGFTVFSLVWGALLGLLRGRNRSILRLILVVLSALIPIIFKDAIVDAIMSFEMDGKTLKLMLTEILTNTGASIPESIQSIIFTLVEILISILVFFVVFMLFSFVSWFILFPILKIFVRKGKKKRALVGALIGLIQGAVISFVVCAPLTGLVVQVDKISSIELQGNQILAIPEEIGVQEYVNSPVASVYKATGTWFFDMISSKKDADGKNISISNTCDVVATVAKIADTFSSLSNDMQAITSESVTPQEQVDTIKKIGDSLINIGNSVDGLNADSKALVQDLLDGVKEMATNEAGELPPEIENAINNLNVDDLKLASAGSAMNGIATYIEKTNDQFENNEPVTQEEIDSIVNGIADNTFLLDVVASQGEATKIVDVDEENRAKFDTAVSNANLSEENKETLRKMFGLNS